MPTYEPSIKDRAARARAALSASYTFSNRDDLECAIIDLLTDLAHQCDRERLNLAQLLDTARGHYNHETEGLGTAFSAPYCDDCGAHHVGHHAGAF